MGKFSKLSVCQEMLFFFFFLASKFCMQMSIFCRQKYQIVSAKAVVQDDFLAYALSIHKENPLRTTKGNNPNRIGP